MKYSTKDLSKALTHLEVNLKAVIVNIEVDDMGRLKLSTFDSTGKHTIITIYKNSDDSSGTMMPEITETRRL